MKFDVITTNVREIISAGVIMSIYKVAYDISKQASDEGFDWDHWTGSYSKVQEELEEVRQEAILFKGKVHPEMIEEFGDLIFSIMSLARHLEIDPEEACQVGVQKFVKRYDEFKKFTRDRGVEIKDTTEDARKELWNNYKKTLAK